METFANIPILLCASQRHWEQWLEENHAEPRGVWLKIAKKGTGIETVSHAEALEVALCYGWIDGLRRGFDEMYFLQKYTPRRPRSTWSKINTDKVMQLIEAGRMAPSGMREVEAARQDGRWDAAYQPQRNLTVPDDLREELDRHPQAKAFFETLNKVNRYAICFRIESARTPATRKSRLDKYITMLEEHRAIYP